MPHDIDTKEQSETKVTLWSGAWEVAEEIRKLSGLQSVEDAILQALDDELYFREKVRDGYQVLVSRSGCHFEVDLTPRVDLTAHAT